MLSRAYSGPETPRKLKKKNTYLKLKELKPLYKYYLKNDIAYTEDHIPVQKLHLFGMPMELTQDALLDYFTRNYGHVLGIKRLEHSLRADEEQEYLPTWNALLLFAHARDAAKVLESSEHLVSSYKFHVQACYSWLQPVTDEEFYDLEFSTSPSILHLNDDCLEYVFQYLSLADQIRMARTCTRFRMIYQRVSIRQHKSVDADITKDLTLWEKRDFCQLSGHHIESLTCTQIGYDNFKRCFYAGLQFPNLKDLYVRDSNWKVHKIQRILLETHKLTKLTLMTQPRNDRLELAHLKELKNLFISEWNTKNLTLPTSIEWLTFYEWQEISCLTKILKGHTQIKKLQVQSSKNIFKKTAGLQAFASVEVLRIRYCDFRMNGVIAQLPKLKKLCLDCSFIDKDFCSEIFKDTPNQLDHLEMAPKHNYDFDKEDLLMITNLTGLQTLALYRPKLIDDEVISAFSKLTELKRFGLDGSKITDSLVLKLLNKCPKLSQLRMEECPNVSENLVDSIIRLLRKDIQSGKNQRDLPFKLYLWECSFKKILQTDPDVVNVFFRNLHFNVWFMEELDQKHYT